MTFGLAQTRYSTDDSGIVHDNLVEYCIDFLCGQMDMPHLFPFALNRVFREYFAASYPDEPTMPYSVISVRVTDTGIEFNHPHNFMEDWWVEHLPPSFGYYVSEDDTYLVTHTGTHEGRGYIFSSEPIALIRNDLQDLTFTLACLILCRDIATKRLTSRYRNNHKVATNGKDKAQK